MSDAAWGNLIGVVTIISMLLFIGIWIWAWRKRHRKVFKRMAEIPMEDSPEGPLPTPNGRAKADAHRSSQP
ncbi:MAG: cbb3-type cytochrome c oxidase subunit 3 [Rhodanobacter sp.]